MELVSGTFFSILLNGGPLQPFTPSIGIRQGDPLSPFLFIIMAEGLGRSLTKARRQNQLKGIKPAHQGPTVTHQQFVDDTMLMGAATMQEARTISQVLKTFSEASGIEINLTKSKKNFFNTSIPVQRNLSRILQIQKASLPTKYLGIPLSEYAYKSANWEALLNKMKARLSNWTYRALNTASRLILVKSVLQTMPAYMFSALAAPKAVYKSIRSIQRSFLWNGASKQSKWALIKWTDICKPKREGGLGLRDPEILSKVVAAKIRWRWVENPSSLWGTWWKAKYTTQVRDRDLIRLTGTRQRSPI